METEGESPISGSSAMILAAMTRGRLTSTRFSAYLMFTNGMQLFSQPPKQFVPMNTNGMSSNKIRLISHPRSR